MLRRISSTIKQYPAATFFIFAFTFTWANWAPQALVSRGLLTVQVPGFVRLVAGYGPALVALYGLMGRVHDLGLTLLAVNRIAPNQPGP